MFLAEGLRGERVGLELGGGPQGFALRRKSSGRQKNGVLDETLK